MPTTSLEKNQRFRSEFATIISKHPPNEKQRNGFHKRYWIIKLTRLIAIFI